MSFNELQNIELLNPSIGETDALVAKYMLDAYFDLSEKADHPSKQGFLLKNDPPLQHADSYLSFGVDVARLPFTKNFVWDGDDLIDSDKISWHENFVRKSEVALTMLDDKLLQLNACTDDGKPQCAPFEHYGLYVLSYTRGNCCSRLLALYAQILQKQMLYDRRFSIIFVEGLDNFYVFDFRKGGVGFHGSVTAHADLFDRLSIHKRNACLAIREHGGPS